MQRPPADNYGSHFQCVTGMQLSQRVYGRYQVLCTPWGIPERKEWRGRAMDGTILLFTSDAPPIDSNTYLVFCVASRGKPFAEVSRKPQ
jgi:hypothetical protein